MAILFSCGKEDVDSVNAYLYNVCFSEFIDDELYIRTYNLDYPPGGADIPYSSFQNLVISFCPGAVSWSDAIKNNVQNHAIASWTEDKLDGIYSEGRPAYSVQYTTSTLSGTIRITSDVSLYGETPGDDLSSHFKMFFNPGFCMYQGHLLKAPDYQIVYPYTTWDASYPEDISSFFFDGLVLGFCPKIDGGGPRYNIVFKDYPSYTIDELNLTVSLPVNETLMFSAFNLDGTFDPSAITERKRTLSGTIHLDFSAKG